MRERPLSPHLTVYRFMYTMTLSIVHRATGVVLSFGLLMLAWWLMAAATGPEAFETATSVLSGWFFQLLLAGWIVSFVYHLCNGIRHLTWDVGLGLEKHQARRSAMLTLVATVLISALLGYLAFVARSAS
jgi:succinate dehydrogenase / fumarate reductase, cytochrome b subunit